MGEKKNEYMREYYKRNSGKLKEQVRRYQQEHPDAVLRTRLRTFEKSPGKMNARRVVEAAIKAGALIKPDACSLCGKTNCRIEAHHEDHSKPLDVTWLCVSCHRKRDHQIRKDKGIIEKPNGRRKLTDDQVREIRSSSLSYSKLSKKYGVSISVLQKVKHHQTYKDVA